jgi:hypothetical protein
MIVKELDKKKDKELDPLKQHRKSQFSIALSNVV